jgi:Na+/proline symporter
MVGAIVANAYAGGALLHELTGINVQVAIVLVSLIALSYSLISGLKASIYTDVIQMFMVLGLALVLVPGVVLTIDDAPARFLRGLSGVDGLHGNLFDPVVAFSMGIPMTITLITGPLADQMFIQRAMAVRQSDVTKTFVYGGLLFGLIPVTLSLLGFFGVSLAQEGAITVSNAEMIGPLVISHVLPKVALYAFALMALAALCSTLDSAMCAVSSLASIDIYQRYISHEASSEEICSIARKAMIALTILGTGIALCEPSMLWTFMITGVITGALYVPTIIALYSRSVSATVLVWAIIASLAIALPLSVYATVTGRSTLLVYASIASLIPGVLGAIGTLVRRRRRYS